MLTIREKFISIVDNDFLLPSDAIILLEGDGYNRYKHAVNLYKANYSPLIVFSGDIINLEYGSYPFSYLENKILDLGVKESDLLHENKSLNTKEQAEQILMMTRDRGWKKIILVASSEHQYRAYLTFLKVILNLKLDVFLINSPVKDLPWFKDDGWGIRFDRIDQEFNRIEQYSKLGHLATYNEAIEYQKWKENQQ